ncbi:Hypothetical predicted protein [Xyrichtys novacula]|uniref:Uncharacterized protein n=1 Tax=Xyrichtys novacula TaxID=13765 RepID=A0AAV1GP54_XYRNO|nr:Hypothetical predicted protein [Xyrichtys novacula]
MIHSGEREKGGEKEGEGQRKNGRDKEEEREMPTDDCNQPITTARMKGEAFTGFNPPSTVLALSVVLSLTD